MDMYFIFNLENLHFGSVEHQSDIFWVSHLSTWHARVFFFHLLSSVFMSSILSSLYLLLLIFMLFFHSQKNKVRATGRLSNIQHFACQQPETTPISIFISISISILAARAQGDYGWGAETHYCIRYTIYCIKNI